MKQKDILFIFVSTFVVVAAWIGFNIYHKWATSTINEVLQMQIKPIDPTFDILTIQKIKARTQITPMYSLEGAAASGSSDIRVPTPSAIDLTGQPGSSAANTTDIYGQ